MWGTFSEISRGRPSLHGLTYMGREHWVWGTKVLRDTKRSLGKHSSLQDGHGLGSSWEGIS